MINIENERALTPGCKLAIHMNNAGAALQPQPVVDAVIDYLRDESLHGGYETHNRRQEEIDQFYSNAARLLSCEASNIAFQVNATEAFSKALSAIAFQKGDVILTSANDYTSNQIQFISLERKLGVRLIHVPDLPEGGIDPQAVKEYINTYNPRLVSVSHIPTNSGLVQDVIAIGDICNKSDTTYLVDACQSVGQMDVDVTQIKCDFLSATMRKFLRGPRGGGFLYVSDRALDKGFEPLMIDMRGADLTGPNNYSPRPGAMRFEGWENNYGVVCGASVAIDHALSVGLDNIQKYNELLSKRLRDGLSTVDGLRILDRGKDLCAIVTLYIEGTEWEALKSYMTANKINCSVALRGNNQLDFGSAGKDVPWALRLSPHYYNTENEVDQVIDVLKAYRF